MSSVRSGGVELENARLMAVGYEYEEDGVLEHCIRAMKYRQLHHVGCWLGRLLGGPSANIPLSAIALVFRR